MIYIVAAGPWKNNRGLVPSLCISQSLSHWDCAFHFQQFDALKPAQWSPPCSYLRLCPAVCVCRAAFVCVLAACQFLCWLYRKAPLEAFSVRCDSTACCLYVPMHIPLRFPKTFQITTFCCACSRQIPRTCQLDDDLFATFPFIPLPLISLSAFTSAISTSRRGLVRILDTFTHPVVHSDRWWSENLFQWMPEAVGGTWDSAYPRSSSPVSHSICPEALLLQ